MKILDKFILGLLRLLPCAFDATNMNRVQVGTITLWIYKTVESVATVVASGFFNPVSDLLNNGDIIIISDTNVPTIDMAVVTSADGAATVTLLNGT